jgi:hypothetical protein
VTFAESGKDGEEAHPVLFEQTFGQSSGRAVVPPVASPYPSHYPMSVARKMESGALMQQAKNECLLPFPGTFQVCQPHVGCQMEGGVFLTSFHPSHCGHSHPEEWGLGYAHKYLGNTAAFLGEDEPLFGQLRLGSRTLIPTVMKSASAQMGSLEPSLCF